MFTKNCPLGTANVDADAESTQMPAAARIASSRIAIIAIFLALCLLPILAATIRFRCRLAFIAVRSASQAGGP
jgi:hypothetical protein